MESEITFIGFGEAGMAFADANPARAARGYDRKLDDPTTRAAKLADFATCGVVACDTAEEAVTDVGIVLSLVTADQALGAASADAPFLADGALWLDLNSVAPDTKRAAAEMISPRARYVDVAVMAPVHPARRGVPLLVSGPHADAGAAALVALGFDDVRIVSGGIGAASSIKMIRSVMVKGIEALSAECVIAAEAAGVREAVIASLDASWPGADWARRFDYNLDRMMVHGLRRAAEMDEVVKTLDALGTGAAMTRGTVARQREIGALHLTPAKGLDDKLAALAASAHETAAARENAA
jgi:3-hydroxyisobutyrate dehydrogenase-like beta-hydroxyacid dehydrogenase